MGRRMPYFIQHLGLNSIEHSREDRFHRLPHDSENGDSDHDANDRVGLRIAQVNAHRANEHGETRPSVGTRVVTVSHECSASYVLPYPDSEDCDSLVANESNYRCGGDGTQVAHRLWMQ